MSEVRKQNVATTSVNSNEGVKAGLNSTDDTKNGQAGIKLGHELKDEGQNNEPVTKVVLTESPTPLFIKDMQGANKGNAQDEKDETEE